MSSWAVSVSSPPGTPAPDDIPGIWVG
jgi:hypothetical protein